MALDFPYTVAPYDPKRSIGTAVELSWMMHDALNIFCPFQATRPWDTTRMRPAMIGYCREGRRTREDVFSSDEL